MTANYSSDNMCNYAKTTLMYESPRTKQNKMGAEYY